MIGFYKFKMIWYDMLSFFLPNYPPVGHLPIWLILFLSNRNT